MILRILRRRCEKIEAENLARLENAERDLQGLRTREGIATQALNARAKRNHWREAIEQMIQGVV